MTLRNVVIALVVVVGAVAVAWVVVDVPEPDLTRADRALVAALTVDLATDDPGDRPVALAEPDAECVSEALVRGLGAERLAALGLDAETVETRGFEPPELALTAGDRDVVLAAFSSCIDLREAAIESLVHDRGQADRACVAEIVTRGVAEELWRYRLGPAGELPVVLEPVREAIDACLG